MGARAQVLVKDGKDQVYLYTHWGAGELEKTVRTAIKKKWRWDDFEYLTRIIFCEMVKKDLDGETGFGIGVSQHGDIELLVTVDLEKQTIQASRYGKESPPIAFKDA